MRQKTNHKYHIPKKIGMQCSKNTEQKHHSIDVTGQQSPEEISYHQQTAEQTLHNKEMPRHEK